MEAFREHNMFINNLNNDKQVLPQRANESFRRFNEASNKYNQTSFELAEARRVNSTDDGTERFSQVHFRVLEAELRQSRNDMEAARNELNDIIKICTKNCTDIETRKNEIGSTVKTIIGVNNINGRANINLDRKTQEDILNKSKTYLSVYEELKSFFYSLVYNIRNISVPQGDSSSGDCEKSLYRHNESNEKTYKYR